MNFGKMADYLKAFGSQPMQGGWYGPSIRQNVADKLPGRSLDQNLYGTEGAAPYTGGSNEMGVLRLNSGHYVFSNGYSANGRQAFRYDQNPEGALYVSRAEAKKIAKQVSGALSMGHGPETPQFIPESQIP